MLDAARGGDEEAFRRLVDGQRAALHSRCYRMLGSFHDAEDALQETMLRAWRGLPRYQGRSALGTWLHRIATNVCIDAIGRRARGAPPIGNGGPIEAGRWHKSGREPVRSPLFDGQGAEEGAARPEARYEQREAVEIAFVAALEHLSARQRAVLVLREGLDFSAREVAEILGTTVVATNSALQRARRAFDQRLPERSERAASSSLADARLRDRVQRFVNAFERRDLGAILAILAEDAMPATGSGVSAMNHPPPGGPIRDEIKT